MTSSFYVRAGLALIAMLALGGMAVAQPVPVGGGPIGQAARQSHPTGALRTPPEKLAKIPVVPEYRDFLPVAVDLSDYFPHIGDQAQQGSCVAWASGFAARAYYAEVVEHRDISDPKNIPSPAFIYDVVHQPGTAQSPCNGGSDPADALELFKHGVMSLADFPYDGRDDASACPTLAEDQIAKGTDFKIAGYEQMKTWDQVKSELAQGNPVLVGAGLDDGFMGLHGPQGGGIWNSAPLDPKAPYEGHEFTLVGYDDQLEEFKFINSWSPEWGDNGFGRLSYQTAYNRITSAYVMRMPGDPQITLAAKDFRSDVVNYFAPTKKTGPSLGAATANAPEPVAGLWCGRVDVSKGVATGFVESQAEVAKIKAQFGDSTDVSGVKITPWPLCETQLTLGGVLGADGAPVADLAAANSDGGHAVTLKAPNGMGYLYAVAFNKNGTVTELEGSGAVSGDVSAMLGKDAQTLVVLASDRSVLDTVPAGESTREFLSQLREALIHNAGHISATLVTELAS